jgi:molecular chaperone GrpE
MDEQRDGGAIPEQPAGDDPAGGAAPNVPPLDDAAPVDSEPSDLAMLQERLATAQAESAQRMAAWQRSQADYENLKKRSQQELSDRMTFAAAALLSGLLPVVDDFERAVSADREQDPAAWADGVQLIQSKLFQFLEQSGVQPIAAEGQPFDPKFHEAIGKAAGPEGQVMVQVLKGYLLGQRVLRPTQVIVGEGDDDASSGPEQDSTPAE